jgi:hypothetical protein
VAGADMLCAHAPIVSAAAKRTNEVLMR